MDQIIIQPLSGVADPGFTVDNLGVTEAEFPPASAGLIDDFDNDHTYGITPWDRDAYWFTDGTYTLEMASDIGGNTTSCLHVRYAKDARLAASPANPPGSHSTPTTVFPIRKIRSGMFLSTFRN